MKALFATSMGWRLLASTMRLSGVTVLMYHSVHAGASIYSGMPVERFARQMQWLHENCDVIEPDTFEDVLHAPAGRKPPVMITFDDGYRDYHDIAYPVLNRLRLPALVFLATGFMDAGGIIWTELVSWAVRTTGRSSAVLPWEASRRFELDSEAARTRFEAVCKQHLKSIPEEECAHWRSELMVQLDVDPAMASAQRRMLDWDEVRAASELTTYGGHTHDHPILSQVSAERQAREIQLCHDRIAAETGVAPIHFAYPNGRAQDFTDATKRRLSESGFRLGYSTIGGVHRDGMDLMAIRRQPTGAANLGDFAWLVAGASEG